MDNNIEYKIMGSVKRIRMKPNCLPSRFDCRKRKFTERKPRAAYKKRQRMSLIKEIEEAENKASDTRLPSSIQGKLLVSQKHNSLSLKKVFLRFLSIFRIKDCIKHMNTCVAISDLNLYPHG